MVNKQDNRGLSDATLASVVKEMDLPRLSAFVEAGARKLRGWVNVRHGKMKKRVLLETWELAAGMIRPMPLIRLKVEAARKKPAK
jgi:hypothetical protein